jgi:hypothetical protein
MSPEPVRFAVAHATLITEQHVTHTLHSARVELEVILAMRFPPGAAACWHDVASGMGMRRASRCAMRKTRARIPFPARPLVLIHVFRQLLVDTCDLSCWRPRASGKLGRPPQSFLAMLISLGLLITSTGVYAVVSPGERQGLVNLYTATNGPGWTGITQGWHNHADASVDPCDPPATRWTGVTCNGTTSITCVRSKTACRLPNLL